MSDVSIEIKRKNIIAKLLADVYQNYTLCITLYFIRPNNIYILCNIYSKKPSIKYRTHNFLTLPNIRVYEN